MSMELTHFSLCFEILLTRPFPAMAIHRDFRLGHQQCYTLLLPTMHYTRTCICSMGRVVLARAHTWALKRRCLMIKDIHKYIKCLKHCWSVCGWLSIACVWGSWTKLLAVCTAAKGVVNLSVLQILQLLHQQCPIQVTAQHLLHKAGARSLAAKGSINPLNITSNLHVPTVKLR